MVGLVRLQRILFTALAVLAFTLTVLSASAHGAAMAGGDETMMSGMSGQSGMAMTCDNVSSCGEDSSLCYFVCVTSGAVLSSVIGLNTRPAPTFFWHSFTPAAPPGQFPSPGDRPPKLLLV